MVAETRHAVIRKMWVQYAAIFETNRLEQSATQALHNRTRDLILQALRVHYRSTIERFHHSHNSHHAAFDCDFRTSCNVTALLDSTANAEPAARRTLLLTPAKFLGRCLKYGTKAIVLEVLQAEF